MLLHSFNIPVTFSLIILEESDDFRGVYWGLWQIILVLNDFRREGVARAARQTAVHPKRRAHFRLLQKVNRLHHLFFVVIWIFWCPVVLTSRCIIRPILIIGRPLAPLWLRPFNCLEWGRNGDVVNLLTLYQGLQILRVEGKAPWSALVQRFVFGIRGLQIGNQLPWLSFCWPISLSFVSILILIFVNAWRQSIKWSLNFLPVLIYIIFASFRITAVFYLEDRAWII